MSFQPRVAPSDKAYPVLSREDVGQLIANGSKVIIVDQYVLKVDAWIKYHPGGDLAILHMVGRDATDEVNALVSSLPPSYNPLMPFYGLRPHERRV